MTSNPPEKTPELPAITTIDELRTYLHAQHGVTVGENDPVMLVFSMHRVFLNDYEHMLDRHNTALTSVLETAIRGLTADAISKNLQEQVRLADRTHQEFESQYKRARWLSTVNIASVFICLPVIIILIVK